MRVPLVYHKGPLFGFDVGSRTVKVAQITQKGKKAIVVGYGFVNFPADTIIEGIIAEPEALAKAVRPLFLSKTEHHISARKVACSLPVGKVFIRTITLPVMSATDLDQAVKLEAEQYVPIPIGDLYLDYEIIEQIPGAEGKEALQNILMVAAPKAIVNSYIQLFDILGLEIDSIEASLASSTRAMLYGMQTDQATLIIDFGSRSADLTIFDRVIRLTGTVGIGGDDLTATLSKVLGISADQAKEIKYKFGVGPSGLQPKIVAAIDSQLRQITAEMRKAIKYYQDRNGSGQKVTQVILSGGSASMPGMVEYLKTQLSLPIIIGDPWSGLETKRTGKPTILEAPMYTTAIGLALREATND